MIASEVTIVDEFFGMVKTKMNKNVQEFLSDYSFRQGKIIEQDERGYVAELHSAKLLNEEQITGMMYVLF